MKMAKRRGPNEEVQTKYVYVPGSERLGAMGARNENAVKYRVKYNKEITEAVAV